MVVVIVSSISAYPKRRESKGRTVAEEPAEGSWCSSGANMLKSRRRAALAAACLLASAAGAQVPGQPPIPPGACESPDEIAARVHYEGALRAELDRRWDDARGEAEAVLQAMPSGPFAEAAQKMLVRIPAERQAGEVPPAATGSSPRAELVTVSTMEGLAFGALLAAAAKTDEKGTTALIMLGTGLGL